MGPREGNGFQLGTMTTASLFADAKLGSFAAA
jgi:hypothetical protein